MNRLAAWAAVAFFAASAWIGLGREAARSHPAPSAEIAVAVARHFPGEERRALAIMWCESRNDPQARSKTRDSGLMQINDIWLGRIDGFTRATRFDVEANVRAAAFVHARQGWRAWRTCARKVGVT
jgi:soluble lytic murein transglycosylase-like protein